MPVRARRLAIQASIQAGGLCFLLAVATWLAIRASPIEVAFPMFGWATGAAVLAATLCTALYVELTMGRRIGTVVTALRSHAHESSLERLPDLGDDEIGDVGRAVNDLLANLTSLEVRMIEQGQELRSTREELILKHALGVKTAELEQRLRERALLFDIVRASASERELDTVLADVASRLGSALELRECFLFLADDDTERLTLRAVFGCDRPSELIGRIVLFEEGVLGAVATSAEAYFADDLHLLEERVWEPISNSGSIAIVPVLHNGRTTGVLAATRGRTGAFSELEAGLLEAIGDQLGLAVRHTQLFEELRRGSQQDDLTGLGNRRLLRIRLEDELLRADRFGHRVSVLAIDIDHFKALNDRHGHPTGDAALRKLAGLMTRNLRRIDTIARVGGEEFVVLLPRTTLEDAEQVAEKIRSLVEQTLFPGGQGQPGGHLTISIGVATLEPEESGPNLLARADMSLYEAKDSGRNRVVLARQASIRLATNSRT